MTVTDMLADDIQAYEAQYGDADWALTALLTPIQANIWNRSGLYPLSVIRRELTGRTLETLTCETMNALLRSGTLDTDTDYERHGVSAPYADWEAKASFYPGRRKGPRFVHIMWKQTLDKRAELRDTYTSYWNESEVTMTTKDKGKRTQNLDAIKRSQAAKRDAVNALIAAHPEEFAAYWAESRKAHGIKDIQAARAERERAEYERLAAKFQTNN